MNWLISLVAVVLIASPAIADSLYFTPYDDPRPEILGMLDGAKDEIKIAAYGLNDQSIKEALIRARGRGVTVFIVVDSSQSALVHQRQVLADLAGYAYVHIGRSVDHHIMHSKFIVVDDKIVEFGSLNFTTDAVKQDNFAVVTSDPDIVARFAHNWTKIDEDMPKQ